MPLIVRRFCTSILVILICTICISAQTSAEVMRERVTKAKAFIAVKNFNAAIYELENIRRETKDATVTGVLNVLLMNSYLEQGDYKRAQDFLRELSDPKKNQNNAAGYYAVAGQVVRGARNQLERYRSLGLSVSDRSLPLEAAVDLEKMRETLELVIDQSRTLAKEKKQSSDAMALIEESTNVRGSLAKDDYDATRWKNEAADARESMANSRSVVVNAVNLPPSDANTNEKSTAADNAAAKSSAQPLNTQTAQTNSSFKPVPEISPETTVVKAPPISEAGSPAEMPAKNISKPASETQSSKEPKKDPAQPSSNKIPPEKNAAVRNRTVAPEEKADESTEPKDADGDRAETEKSDSPLKVGSLIEYATQKASPIYPLPAKNLRMTGVVRVDLVVDEKGQVAEVQKTSGPPLLQRAASDAVKKWKFKPFTRDGAPVKAIGFISFNFNL